MKSSILIILLVLIPLLACAQNLTQEQFIQFSRNQEKTLHELIQNKDLLTWEKGLESWLDKYKQLSPKDQRKFQTVKYSIYYDLACAYSLNKKKQLALQAFKKAIDAGFCYYYHALQDSDLDFIRNERSFARQMKRLCKVGNYLYILKKANKYTMDAPKAFPTFTYQRADNENLVRIRNYFNLDSIAGKGDDISQIKNLLYWVHNIVSHDGSSDNPQSRNAIDLIEICKKENRGVNCRMMATILNECYLAMGYNSRFVTCLPKSETDQDCHVINIVYSPSLRKWVWMDPTFNAYVTDEKGNLLSIAEVRTRLIQGLPLVLNEDANWNNKTKQTKEKYLDSYMTKNLYCFGTYARSEYNTETQEKGKKSNPHIYLYSKGYKRSTDSKQLYITTNADYFWQLPE